jgi:four helix bundle protein
MSGSSDHVGETGSRRPETGNESSTRGTVRRFEDLEIWKEGMQLAADAYLALKGSRDRSLADQMQRCAVSIPSNIAEGFERGQNKEFVQFLYYARGSCGELRTQIQIATQVGILPEDHATKMLEKSRKLSAMLSKYIQVRKTDF